MYYPFPIFYGGLLLIDNIACPWGAIYQLKIYHYLPILDSDNPSITDNNGCPWGVIY